VQWPRHLGGPGDIMHWCVEMSSLYLKSSALVVSTVSDEVFKLTFQIARRMSSESRFAICEFLRLVQTLMVGNSQRHPDDDCTL